ncbi:hypothetical protein [Curtobacterium flaccumfaciens]|uniref:hypothetical protein n=1 Tax=Curtobacterium flaccumfaciens TaxID=2035 RepID=UPI001366C022|nr:hypothetical protein [Curtobacterium flaccumfaciens]MBT1664235.1 hypothetical protein [Curtobacterium flaccumfaciens pv. flaccumfaciens]QFS79100.2 hypothetical protein GBG65_05295 [Curtobacterium flaccumfaciens pv. flaccumfaciens]
MRIVLDTGGFSDVEVGTVDRDDTELVFRSPAGAVVARHPVTAVACLDVRATGPRSAPAPAPVPAVATTSGADDPSSPLVVRAAPTGNPQVDVARLDRPAAYAPWTQQEDTGLEAMTAAGMSVADVAIVLRRQDGGVRSRLRHLRGAADETATGTGATSPTSTVRFD